MDKKSKKLVIVTTVPITLKGILRNQPKYLDQHYDVTLISSPSIELDDVSNHENVTTYAVPMTRGISPFKDLSSIIAMIKQLRRIKPVVVHSYTPKAGLVAMLASFVCRVPVRIHTFTGLMFPTATGIKKKILIWIDRLICACATTVVPEGSGVRQDLIDYRVTKKKLEVIGNGNIAGVDTHFFSKEAISSENLDSKLRNTLALPDSAFVFCFVGRFTQDKGIAELISSFKQLPEKAHLVLVGETDKRIPITDDIALVIDSHPRIHNLGWQNDIRPALAISDVLVLPSYREGFPNTPLQAGAMGLPCIVTDINGCNEIIVGGYNGWVISAKDVKSLKNAMMESMESVSLTSLGANARENIELKFEQNLHWQNMLHFYQHQLNSLSK
ncbi:glycosyltransferase family 4 protein [Thalassotalea ponticola]|uniref:glycosyltransferase family 4 protein n=1 Tax=Thalassotalea ponticola TaxID=1523392 RepID=UPI0025B5F752|nr:glycosyltransferase family 4 protein [Thalassotalea ponticola]MDN3652656.1 glycosyltransferase family 4 protein [Thalassotalea ponticola]